MWWSLSGECVRFSDGAGQNRLIDNNTMHVDDTSRDSHIVHTISVETMSEVYTAPHAIRESSKHYFGREVGYHFAVGGSIGSELLRRNLRQNIQVRVRLAQVWLTVNNGSLSNPSTGIPFHFMGD